MKYELKVYNEYKPSQSGTLILKANLPTWWRGVWGAGPNSPQCFGVSGGNLNDDWATWRFDASDKTIYLSEHDDEVFLLDNFELKPKLFEVDDEGSGWQYKERLNIPYGPVLWVCTRAW